MNKERLRYLITIMERLRDDKKLFNMGSWANPNTTFSPDRTFNMCGTSACALGHAAFDPQCIADGLVMNLGVQMAEHSEYKHLPLRTNADWVTAVAACSDAHDYMFVPMFEGREGFDAGSAYYDIDYDESNYLFDPSSYPKSSWGTTPDDVIEHINKLLSGTWTPPDVEDDEDQHIDEQAKPDVGFV